VQKRDLSMGVLIAASAMLDEGATYREVQARFNVSRTSLRARLKKMGMKHHFGRNGKPVAEPDYWCLEDTMDICRADAGIMLPTDLDGIRLPDTRFLTRGF